MAFKEQDRLGLIIAVGISFCALDQSRAGVVLDGTVGPAGALTGPNYAITANLGRQVGGNLFHSLSQFNLATGESATFSGPNTVQNIIARVTGGESSIDGAIISTIPGANLFLINPAGFLFGADASVNVGGSFAVTTAGYVKLADGGRFDAVNPANDVLTSAPISAFGFLDGNRGSITINGSQLQTTAGNGISIIGGDIQITGGQITSGGGQIVLTAIKSAGEFPATPDMSSVPQGGEVNLSGGTTVDASGASGGAIVIRGQNLTLNESSILSGTTGGQDGGALDSGPKR